MGTGTRIHEDPTEGFQARVLDGRPLRERAWMDDNLSVMSRQYDALSMLEKACD